MLPEKTNKKPLILEIAEAEHETVAAVNEIMRKHNLPCSFFEPIVAGIYRQLVEGKKNEINTAAAQYEEQEAARSESEKKEETE